ncbi:hypothetical protein DSM104635_02964 [Terricaulis silvestris]|uniref:DUF6980 domain-containing protein n=2 Tax=Terricaulis silvestris TaxID=2686094 RepID=A0A6I6MTK7_9CAUL|nr:hypothetical protein DSM104635_02964 [Terricaulis silvestris]
MNHCCDSMERDLAQVCGQHADRFDCPDALITFNSETKRYGLIIHDGGSSAMTIAFCPWCGANLQSRGRTE